MLAAAIRASLIEAGEPDTSQQAECATSSHQPDSQPSPSDHDRQQQDGMPLSSPSVAAAALQQPYADQHQPSHSQQQRQQQHQQALPNGHGLASSFSAAAYQLGNMASALQDTASTSAAGQGNAHRDSGKVGTAELAGHMRPSWSTTALLHMDGQRDHQDGDGLVSASSTPAPGTH